MALTNLPDQLIRTRRFSLGGPHDFRIGGGRVLFRRSDAVWVLDLATGSERRLTAGHRVDGYATDETARLAAFVSAGELSTVDPATGVVRGLPATGPVTDPRPDPAGRRIAYRSGSDLRLIEADGSGDRLIEAAGSGDRVIDPAGAGGCRWAPDGSRILTDGLRIVGLDGTRIEARGDAYVAATGWDGDGPYAVVQSRDQRTVRLLAIDPATGRTTTLSEQDDERWVTIVPGLPARTPAGAIVSHADRDGTRHLTVAGVQVTPPGLQLRAVLDATGPEILFTASDEPTETHLFTYRPGSPVRRRTEEPGVHTGIRRDDVLVHVVGDRTTVRRAGHPDVAIASVVERPVLEPRPTRLTLGTRELRAALFRPSWHRPGRRLPVLVDVYGGASRQRVTVTGDWRDVVSQWFAEQGFAVLVADGSGTPGRGPDWEREVHGDLYGRPLTDQIAALHAAAARCPELDLGRVAIRGWSFGGSMAALAVLRHPDVFHVAVAGGAVTDQRRYDPYRRERFLGHPDDFPDRYDANSLIRAAPTLTRPLLLMHGLADDNVRPEHTERLSAALRAAGRPHEVVLLPGTGHSAIGSPAAPDVLTTQLRFLQRHLSRAECG